MTTDAGAGFAALMSSAADSAVPEPSPAVDPEAPWGYLTEKDGTVRPKRAPGRGPKSPPIDELKAARAAEVTRTLDAQADRAPEPPKTSKLTGHQKAPEAPLPDYRAGVITKAVNKLYRRAGKLVRAMDADIGAAIIESAKNTDEDGGDDSVGAAWDTLAKTNPRIRRFILKAVAGGAWGDLLMAHAPIGLAIIMKPAIMNHIPFGSIIESFAEPDEDTAEDEGGLPGGMTADDARQMSDLAGSQMRRMAASMGLSPEIADEAMAAAQQMASGGAPPAFIRQQPKRTQPRAKR